MLPVLVTGSTRSSARVSLLETAHWLGAIETEEISTLPSHKSNQGSHDSLLRDFGTRCYLQEWKGERDGHTEREGNIKEL